MKKQLTRKPTIKVSRQGTKSSLKQETPQPRIVPKQSILEGEYISQMINEKNENIKQVLIDF